MTRLTLELCLALFGPRYAGPGPASRFQPALGAADLRHAGVPEPVLWPGQLAGGRLVLHHAGGDRGESGQNLVRYDSERGAREVLVAARQFIPQGDSVPLVVEDYAWSPDPDAPHLHQHAAGLAAEYPG